MRTKVILGETLVAFKQGRKLLASSTAPGPSYRTLVRWAKDGLPPKGDSQGQPITMEHYYIGSRLFTSVEAFQRWLEKINQQSTT